LGQLRPISFADARRKLIAAGFTEVSQVGSHVKFAKAIEDGLRTTIVPNHREIAVGTIRSILRQAGLSVDDWNRF
jgi:predicted RNA binding protein YcfA (HicA-like mRNA interferase family)